MAIALDEQDGQTPLDPDEKAGLIPEHLTTKSDMNDWEQENILRAVRWLKRVRAPDVLSERFCRELHKQMFGKTWAWAGTFRKSDKSIGCDWTQIGVKLAQLFGNTRWWVDNATFPPDEIAARFHRDLPRSTNVQTSMFPALSAFISMKSRRGSTSSPISIVNT